MEWEASISITARYHLKNIIAQRNVAIMFNSGESQHVFPAYVCYNEIFLIGVVSLGCLSFLAVCTHTHIHTRVVYVSIIQINDYKRLHGIEFYCSLCAGRFIIVINSPLYKLEARRTRKKKRAREHNMSKLSMSTQ